MIGLVIILYIVGTFWCYCMFMNDESDEDFVLAAFCTSLFFWWVVIPIVFSSSLFELLRKKLFR